MVITVLEVMSFTIERLVSKLVSDSLSSSAMLSVDAGHEPITGLFLTPGFFSSLAD